MSPVSGIRENLTYDGFGAAVRELAQTIADDGYEPDIVLSIARGGVFVAGALAYALDCKNIHLVNVESYTRRTYHHPLTSANAQVNALQPCPLVPVPCS